MASEFVSTPRFLATREGEARQAQFSTSDYGAVGDQRPYQIVQPGYPAPKFLGRFQYLGEALRECGTLCQLTGQPFRLVKWGSRIPCFPCRQGTRNRLPSLHIKSPGALDGFSDAMPVADFTPSSGTLVYDSSGQPKLVGGPNFLVTRTPTPPASFINQQPLTQRYADAVRSAVYLANDTGKTAYICSSKGADCKSRNPKDWLPVVYVQPGGLVQRYPTGLKLSQSANGSITGVTPVTENEFQELVRQSAGRTRLGQGA